MLISLSSQPDFRWELFRLAERLIHTKVCTVKCSKKLGGGEDSSVCLVIASTLQMS